MKRRPGETAEIYSMARCGLLRQEGFCSTTRAPRSPQVPRSLVLEYFGWEPELAWQNPAGHATTKVNGVTLNSALMKGEQRKKPLPASLFRFWEGAVGVFADIKEMFHQVFMQPRDRCGQRFLWRNWDDRWEPDIYEMQYSSTDSRSVLAINEYHYVDDYVDTFASEEEAISHYWVRDWWTPSSRSTMWQSTVAYYGRILRLCCTGWAAPIRQKMGGGDHKIHEGITMDSICRKNGRWRDEAA